MFKELPAVEEGTQRLYRNGKGGKGAGRGDYIRHKPLREPPCILAVPECRSWLVKIFSFFLGSGI